MTTPASPAPTLAPAGPPGPASAIGATSAPSHAWVPAPASGISARWVEANGIRFDLAECGDGGWGEGRDGGEADGRDAPRLALMLHGFPELNYSWRAQMPLFAARGYRVWAPNMRGYGGSSRPDGVAAYRLDTLAADVAALIDAASAEAGRPVEVTLVAHDWGALVAWHCAIRQVRPLCRLIIMNVPHPKCSEREIRRWHQLRKSWYIFFFQLPWLPERLLTRDDAVAIKRIFVTDALNTQHFSGAVQQVYADAALRPGAMTAMLNYYRALLRLPDMRAIGGGMVHVPTLMIWGENDGALDLRCTDGTATYVPDFELRTLPGVSHWVQQDAPDAVNAILTDWLDRRGG